MVDQRREISIHEGRLFGCSGGGLEYAGQKVVYRKGANGEYRALMILYFTDHDMWACGEPSISEEFYAHYSIEVGVSDFGG